MSDVASQTSPVEEVLPVIPDHSVIRQIGRGSYGEVWLARSATGIYRAVKVVRRAGFDRDRPYEREFEGLRKFEPISRSNENQVHVLHVGRDDTKGYFYYVMELADDQERGQNIEPETYAPRTLRSDLRKQERLPPEECISIGLHLVGALKNLHARGLIHRDVKPSNIIYVNGVPKLADIGLIAGVDDARSMVGTEGYVPLEGAGTPLADLYALGMVLYEAGTGRDRFDYPELHTGLRGSPERQKFHWLNEVINRACSRESGERFQSAEEMEQALECARENRPFPRPIRKASRRTMAVTLTAAAIALLATIAGLVSSSKRLRLVRDIDVPGVVDWSGGRLGDYDGDGQKDIFLVHSKQLLVISSQGSVLNRSDILGDPGSDLAITTLGDVDGDRKDEIFVSWRAGGMLYSGVLNQSFRSLRRIEMPGVRYQGGIASCSVEVVAVIGKPATVLGVLTSGFADQSQRGLVCFDFATTNEFWRQPTAPFLKDPVVLQLEGRSEPVVVAGSYSPANGDSLPDGTDDSQCYLYAWNVSSGEPEWKMPMGEAFTACVPLGIPQRRTGPVSRSAKDLFLEAPGIPDDFEPARGVFAIVFRDHRWGPEKERGEVWEISPKGDLGRHYDTQASICSWMVPKGLGPQPDRLLLADRHGVLHVLDTELENSRKVSLVKRRFDAVELMIDTATDLDGDGKTEFILHSFQRRLTSPEPAFRGVDENSDWRVWVLDEDFDILGEFLVDEAPSSSRFMAVAVSEPGPSGRREIIVLTQSKAMVLEWSR